MKKEYIIPTTVFIELQQQTSLLQASATPPNEIPDYDNGFWAPRRGGKGQNGCEGNDEEEEEDW